MLVIQSRDCFPVANADDTRDFMAHEKFPNYRDFHRILAKLRKKRKLTIKKKSIITKSKKFFISYGSDLKNCSINFQVDKRNNDFLVSEEKKVDSSIAGFFSLGETSSIPRLAASRGGSKANERRPVAKNSAKRDDAADDG